VKRRPRFPVPPGLLAATPAAETPNPRLIQVELIPHTETELEVIAHRGFSAVAPENTLAAVQAALDAGAHAVEWDLQTASCGTPVLFHDPHLGRTSNGFGPVRRRTLGQLQALDVGSWFSPEFQGEKIPSFAEALQMVSGSEAHVYAEVKGYRELEDLDRMVRIVQDAGMIARTHFISLDFGIVDRIAGQDAEVGIGYVVDDANEVDEAIRKAGELGERGMVDYDRTLVLQDPGLVERTLSTGADVAVWTVDDTGEADRLRAAGVRRFTTNQVAAFVEWASAQ